MKPAVLTPDDIAFMLREVNFILNASNLPACPDPVCGGCIGTHCIKCAARELRGFAKSFLDENTK